MASKKQFKNFLSKQFGTSPGDYFYYNAENRLEKVSRYNKVVNEFYPGTNDVDDVTWNDLEMDRLFCRINHTNSFIGEQLLYHKLHVLKLDEEDNKLITSLDGKNEFINEMEFCLNGAGKRDESYHLVDFLFNSNLWIIGKSYIYHILQLILLICIIFTAVFRNAYAIAGLITIALVNIVIYYITKSKYEIYIDSLSDFKRIYDCAEQIRHYDKEKLVVNDKLIKSLDSLKGISRFIVGSNNRKYGILQGDPFAILSDYLFGICLYDISMFNYNMKSISKKFDDILYVVGFIGKLDAAIAVLSYRASIAKWCEPRYVNGDAAEISATALYHPLIKDAVPNDFVLRDRAVITGANASGKSTFMKSLAINCILAQTINTCSASEFSMKPVTVITCMALRDDVISGESYYLREAKYIKRMLDIISKNEDVLIVIDEILKGTNTKERIAASKAIMHYVSEYNCFAVVATHDNILAENEKYSPYYFSSKVSDEEFFFDYKINKGICDKSNAIDLLAFLGYPEIIVKEARENIN